MLTLVYLHWFSCTLAGVYGGKQPSELNSIALRTPNRWGILGIMFQFPWKCVGQCVWPTNSI